MAKIAEIGEVGAQDEGPDRESNVGEAVKGGHRPFQIFFGDVGAMFHDFAGGAADVGRDDNTRGVGVIA